MWVCCTVACSVRAPIKTPTVTDGDSSSDVDNSKKNCVCKENVKHKNMGKRSIHLPRAFLAFWKGGTDSYVGLNMWPKTSKKLTRNRSKSQSKKGFDETSDLFTFVLKIQFFFHPTRTVLAWTVGNCRDSVLILGNFFCADDHCYICHPTLRVQQMWRSAQRRLLPKQDFLTDFSISFLYRKQLIVSFELLTTIIHENLQLALTLHK